MASIRPVYFFARAFPEALEAFRRFTPGSCAFTDPGADGSYWKAFSAAWDDPEGDLLCVEQDVVVHGRVLPTMKFCGHDWCEFPHPNRSDPRSNMRMSLGCTKFSALARAAVPSSAIAGRSAWEGSMHAYCEPGVPRWNQIDGPVHRCLLDAGFTCHEHEPPVRHLTAE